MAKSISNEEAQRFPKSRPWDHAIDLVKDAPELLNCKVYSLPPGQQELLDAFLKEHEEKGYIRRSRSHLMLHFLYVKKERWLVATQFTIIAS